MTHEEKVKKVEEILGEYLIKEPKDVILKGFGGKYIDVFVLRKVVSNVIFRNTDRTELTYTTLGKRLHVEVYSRKLKTPERLTGIRILREFGLLSNGYFHNALSSAEQLKNPVSMLYGDSVTKEGVNAPPIPSRILYSWALSIERYETVSKELTHNALSEQGTMWNPQEGRQLETLFKNIYMYRGHLLQLVSFYNVTAEEFIFGLGNLLFTETYGAEDTVNPRNIQNEILLIVGSSPFEVPVTPYTIIKSLSDDEVKTMEDNPDTVKDTMKRKLKEAVKTYKYTKIIEEEKLNEIIGIISDIYNNKDLLKHLVEDLREAAKDFIDTLMGKVKKNQERNKVKGKKT